MSLLSTAIVFALISLAFGLQTTQPSPEGALQCQCTCSPVGVPNKTIYTSGNMEVVKQKSNIEKATTPIVSQETLPTVEATRIPIDKTVTQFKDVAVSKIRNSLGHGPTKSVNPVSKNEAKPKIKWLHSASTNDASKPQALKQVSQKVDLDVDAKGRLSTGAMMKNKVTTVREVIMDKPTVTSHMSTVQVTQKDVVQDPLKTEITSVDNRPSNVTNEQHKTNSIDQSKNSNQKPDVIKDHVQPKITNDQQTTDPEEPSHTDPSQPPQSDPDQVAADIGFVLDGSAPNPILSGVVSGLGQSSMGTGYIVENIGKKPHNGGNYGFLMDKNAEVNPYSSTVRESQQPSLVQQSSGKNNDISTKDASSQTTVTMTTKNNNQAKSQKQSNSKNQNTNQQSQDNSPKNNKQSNVDKVLSHNSNMQTTNKNTNNAQQKNNNIWNKRKPWINNNPKGNHNRKPWQSNNQQNGGNRQTWNSQLKPFQIQSDFKQNGGWNSNSQWEGNNWGTTQTPGPTMSSMALTMLGMDPLLFLGQHHL